MTFIIVHPSMVDELREVGGFPADRMLIQGEIGQVNAGFRFVVSPHLGPFVPKQQPRRRQVAPSWRRTPVQVAALVALQSRSAMSSALKLA